MAIAGWFRVFDGAKMIKLAPIIIMLSLAFSATYAKDAIQLSDADLNTELVGAWIVPPDSTDYGVENRYSVKTYAEDGSEILVSYDDRDCKKIVTSLTARWIVENGILITTLPNGQKLRDEILALKNGSLTLHSLDDETTYTRIRGTVCGTKAS